MAETKKRRWAYKVGFLQKLAEMGVRPDEFFGHAKRAFFDPTALGASALKSTGDIGAALLGGLGTGLTTAGKGLGYTALGAPIALGAGSGAMSAAFSAPTPEDIQVLRNVELIALYERLTKEINARRARKASMS